MTWQDDGVKLLLDISETGSYITPPMRTDYPFVRVATGAPPQDWTAYIPVGAAASDVILNVSGSEPVYTQVTRSGTNTQPNTGLGITRTFSVTPHHVYQVGVIVKASEAKTASVTNPWLSCIFRPPSGNGLSRSSNPYPNGLPDATNWYAMTVDQQATNAQGIGCTTLDVTLYARTPTGGAQGDIWSAQFANVYVVDVTAATAPTFTWHQVQCDAMDASVRYGRARFTERYDVGTYNILLNNMTGEYMYQEEHPWGFRPGRMFRMRAQYRNKTYPICFGVIDRIKTVMTPEGKATVSLTVFDTTSYTSDIPTPQISFMSPSTLNDPDSFSGNRVNALLNFAGVAQSLRAIDPGIFGTQNVNESGRGLREEIGITADSEGGSFFGERDGTIVYRDRSWSSRDPRGGTVQANFTAFPAELNIGLQPDNIPTDPNAPVICPNTMDTDWSLERVINAITLAVQGGTKRSYADQPSQLANGIRTYQRLDFVNWGGSSAGFLGGTLSQQLQARANDIFSTSLNALLRVQRLSYRPGPETWEWTFTVFLDWLVRVFYYIRDGTWGFATVVRVQSLTHRITPTDWVVELDVDQPISYTDEVLPLPPGGWDVANWDAAVWDDEQYTNAALWSAGFRWSNPESKWGE